MNFDLREAAMHEIVASVRFPGPNYYEVLGWLHQELKPETYLEIGVFRGNSLRLANPPTVALGIDPFPEADVRWRTKTQVLSITSTEFFAQYTLREFLGVDCFALAFVDGLHQFEQAISDIFHLEAYAQPESVIVVHDTIPLDEKTASRERRTMFHTGDVWKVIPFLKSHRPDLEFVTVNAGPSGLTLITGFNPFSQELQAANRNSVEQFRDLPWEYYKQHRNEFLETIPNQRDEVAGWLFRTRSLNCARSFEASAPESPTLDQKVSEPV